MQVALGIDTGGTYTDAVLANQDSGAVLAGAKSLTTYDDLSVGVCKAITAVFEAACRDGLAASCRDVGLVGLSTTLATNSIVEGRGRPVCLFLIGYDPALIAQHGFAHDLVTQDVIYIRGGHDADGNEVSPLDEEAVREAVLARLGQVEAFAVSGYFGVRNPAHELRTRDLIQSLLDARAVNSTADDAQEMPFPVTCGHELTTRLDAIRRATTAVLNARLIPLLRDLIVTVRRALNGMDIRAPLMIVKGDGSLMRADWAMRRPIETVLSGPAASVVGAWRLAGQHDPSMRSERGMWVVDVGGTTTDIAVLRDGRPRLNPEGAQVGGWCTMVEAVDVHTVGLGGDSHVRLDGSTWPGANGLTVGPRRVVPLCMLASEHPRIIDELRHQVHSNVPRRLTGQFVLAQRRPGAGVSQRDLDLLCQLEEGPQSLAALAGQVGYGYLAAQQVEELVAQQLVMRSGFTPTDALHVLGRFVCWDVEAARLGAELLASQFGLSVDQLCEQVVAQVSDRVTIELVSKVLGDEVALPAWDREPSATEMLARAMGQGASSDLECQLTLRQPIVAVGAPVDAYLPRTAHQLRTGLIIPPHADVANAVGAVVGGVVQRARVLIRPMDFEAFYRVHLPGGVRDFLALEEGVEYARLVVPEQLQEMARRAGAEHVEVQMIRQDIEAPVKDWGQGVFIETELLFVAVGRPSPI